ncbi:MAG: endolytic transglycosylase MltG [Candidatus Paceibacterota bacterium]|jgi:UPF0755 protein
MDENNTGTNLPSTRKIIKLIPNLILIIGFLGLFAYYFLSAPFSNKDIIIHVASGQSINSVTEELETKNAVRHDLALKVFIKLLKSGKGIITGDYLIKKNSPVWVIAWQLSRGHHNIEPIKVTIREGLTNEEIADLLADKLAGFRKDLFLTNEKAKQGYLFPDTYFFFPLDTGREIVDKLTNSFENQIKNLLPSINASQYSLNEIITMASILEGEAGGKEDIEIISGILWKRISIGMPLQVDIDKSTYQEKGLPAKPLNNPGLQSINAAIYPNTSSYLYYLHDKNGKVHFATTYTEHKRNIDNYLK